MTNKFDSIISANGAKTAMKMLPIADQLFLRMETPTQPMHVGGLLLFSFPEDAGDDYVTQLADYFRSFETPLAPFNQRIVSRFGQYFTQEDPEFDLEHHFRHRALPKPGRIRELLSYVSAVHSNPIDKHRPLWEFNLIEGFEDRRFAFYVKVHHAMVDGVSAMRMMTRILSADKTAKGMPPLWAFPDLVKSERYKNLEPVSWRKKAKAAVMDAKTQLVSLPKVSKLALNSIAFGGDGATSFSQAPMTMLNTPVTSSRRFAAQSFSLSRVKAIATSSEGTVNDVILSMCGSALRQYLMQYDGLPAEALVAAIPVSLHSKNETEDTGNHVSVILANIGTNLQDPLERINAVKRSVKGSKQRLNPLTKSEINTLTALSGIPTGLQLLTGAAPMFQGCNVVVSNVPGPKDTRYHEGAELQGIYPVSIPANRMALNITVLSYRDSLEFGLTACRRTLPSMQKLLGFLEESIEELEAALELSPSALKKSEIMPNNTAKKKSVGAVS